MPELYLRLLDRVMTPILLLFALVLLLRGHNQPGGGFIAGLVVASAFQLQMLSRSDGVVRTNLGPYVQPIIGIGLLISVASAILGIFQGGFFKGVWWTLNIGSVAIDISTPITFDIGVFLVVFGVVTSYLLGLSRKD